jgi:hypothetical protein
LLVCNWPHSIGQNHFYVMMLSNRDSATHKCFKKILHSFQARKFDSLSAVRTMCHTVRTPICPKCHPSGQRIIPSGRTSAKASSVRTTRTFRPDLPLSRSFNLLQLASIWTFQQHVRAILSVRQASEFLSKVQLWEDRCNRPDDVDSRPDALIHKASIAIQIQMFGRACIRYGNPVHQINRPDDRPPGLDTRSLYMEITCSGRQLSGRQSTTVRTRLRNKNNFSEILGQLIPQLSIWTAYDYRPDGA